jgi:hypothetical protein
VDLMTQLIKPFNVTFMKNYRLKISSKRRIGTLSVLDILAAKIRLSLFPLTNCTTGISHWSSRLIQEFIVYDNMLILSVSVSLVYGFVKLAILI